MNKDAKKELTEERVREIVREEMRKAAQETKDFMASIDLTERCSNRQSPNDEV